MSNPIGGTFTLQSRGATVTLPYDATGAEVTEAGRGVAILGYKLELLSKRHGLQMEDKPQAHSK